MPAEWIQNEEIEKALIMHVSIGHEDRRQTKDSIAELERLANTAGATIVGSITQHRDRPTPNFFIGSGKLEEIQLACRRANANLVISNNELSSVQVNNLDIALNIKVIDRTELILQIFARRAQSSEAQVQVELAQLEYLVSRIPVSAKQQRFKGGIGMKGPGESPFQLRNEPMRKRIKDLKRKLAKIQQRRHRTRGRRPWPSVALVGYTNAGKSTLLNAFTEAKAYVDDRLFATLDTKTRLVHLSEGNKILLTDTVGFIRQLPHSLVASFKSTLDEVRESDLLLIVADAGHLHVADHLKIVAKTLKEIGADNVPSLLLLNKCDNLAARNALHDLLLEHPRAITLSATKRQGLVIVKDRITEHLHQM